MGLLKELGDRFSAASLKHCAYSVQIRDGEARSMKIGRVVNTSVLRGTVDVEVGDETKTVKGLNVADLDTFLNDEFKP